MGLPGVRPAEERSGQWPSGGWGVIYGRSQTGNPSFGLGAWSGPPDTAGARRPDPVKAAIDAVVARWGWEPPVWYQAIKDEVEPVSGDPSSLADAARQAGLVDVSASVRRPDLGVRGPRALVAYRLAVPHIASWLATLGAPARDEVARQALAAVRHIGQWRPAVIILAGRVEGQPSGPAARSRAWA